MLPPPGATAIRRVRSLVRIRPPAAMAGASRAGMRLASGVAIAWRRWRHYERFYRATLCVARS